MYRFGVGFLLVLLWACGNGEIDLSGNTPLKPNQFFNAFAPINQSVTFADTNLLVSKDTQQIASKLLQNFLPDSVVKKISTKDGKTHFYALGRIEKANELYLLIATKNANNKGLFAVVFDKKENTFLSCKSLLQPNNNNNGYYHYVTINKEPTFTICQEKQAADRDLLFTKNGWAFVNNRFVLVVKESNEKMSSIPVVNPIDTLPRNNILSGLYAQDSRNFISIRDGKTPQQYLFFLHIEKNDGKCIGELKGELKMTNATTGIYSFAGDPCIIDFNFEGNRITIKEQGSCGNRRGMNCMFEDEFVKKKEAKRVVTNPVLKPITKLKAKPAKI